jgi:deazaflavin-dependent oxidoreductase (nitroreductase family)
LTSPADQLNQRTIAEFRANHGRVGGNFAGAPLLLLHTSGARSGQPRINPVMYLADGDRYLVFASKAGSDRNPGWYWNLRANPDATIEAGDETIAVHATEDRRQPAGKHPGRPRDDGRARRMGPADRTDLRDLPA